jgi:hypothetical protein
VSRRDWTNIGREHGHSGTPDLDAKISRAIERLEWLDLATNRQAAMMPAMGISEAIAQLRIPKVSHYAISNELAPYGFYAIRGHYSNGMAQVYIIDAGDSLMPVCMDFTPKESEASNG